MQKFREDEYAIIRVWKPRIKGKIYSRDYFLTETILGKDSTLSIFGYAFKSLSSKKELNIGHISIELVSSKSAQSHYASHWPSQVNKSIPVIGHANQFHDDKEAEGVNPDEVYKIFSLQVEPMITKFEEISKKAKYFLRGKKILKIVFR